MHKDIKELGKCNFKFEVLEECEENDLKSKELQYIKKINPYYNHVGKERPAITKLRLSFANKKAWNKMSDEVKSKIISQNLKGRPKGHTVSEETREKIRQTLKARDGKKVMILETGQMFNKVKDLEEYLGASTGTVASYFKGKIKSVKGFNVVECRD